MREARRPERRLAREREVELGADVVGDLAAVERGELHEEVVRVLAVVQRLAVQRLAALQQQRVAAASDRRGLEREHACAA